MINLKHNERSWDIQWEYHGRVGNVRAGDLIRKSYGSYPQLQVDPALTLYRDCRCFRCRYQLLCVGKTQGVIE